MFGRAGDLPIGAVNRLLEGERWARVMLQRHAGHTAAIDFAGIRMRFSVSGEGLLAPVVGDEVAPDVQIILPATALPYLTSGMAEMGRHAQVIGNAHFAETIQTLARYLRPDIAAALSPLVGDAIAHRVGEGVEMAMRSLERSARNLGQNVVEHFRDEQAMLVRQSEWQSFSRAVATMRDDVARLEKRLERLTAPHTN